MSANLCLSTLSLVESPIVAANLIFRDYRVAPIATPLPTKGERLHFSNQIGRIKEMRCSNFAELYQG